MTYISLKTKTLERFEEENDKIPLDWIGREIAVRGVFEKVWKKKKKTLFKTLIDWFSIGQKLNSINQASIEPSRFKPKFLSHFWSVEKQIWSIENLENSKFWKIEQFYAKSHQSTVFHEWNTWVWNAQEITIHSREIQSDQC